MLVFIAIKLVLVTSLNINVEFKFNCIEIINWQLINLLKLRSITCPFKAKIFLFNEEIFQGRNKGFLFSFFHDRRFVGENKNFANCLDVLFLPVL